MTDRSSETAGAGLTIGVDVGGTKIAGALCDAAGQMLARRTAPTWPDDGGPRGLDALIAVIADLHNAPERNSLPVRALGIGVPGVTRHAEGIVAWAPGLEWRDLPLGQLLRDRFGVPAYLENDVNLATLGEWWRGTGQGVDDLVGLFIGTGIGAGIVAGGRLLHGAHEAAGEVGYLLPDRAALDRTYPGFGALEEFAAGPGIARRAAAALADARGAASSLRAAGPTPDTRAVFAAARQGDPLAATLIEETLDVLALALANIACVLDPARVVLGGTVGAALAPWHDALTRRLTGRIQYLPEIVTAALGADAGILGAVANAERGMRNAE